MVTRLVFALLIVTSVCKGEEVAYESLYDNAGVSISLTGEPDRNARYIRVQGTLGRQGILVLDGNHCAVDEFGERDVCTQIHFPPIKVALPAIATMGNWTLYSIEPHLTPIRNYTLRLAVNKAKPATANLLLNSAFAPDKVLDTILLRQTEIQEMPTERLLAKDAAKTHTITMEGLSFKPAVIEIEAGDRIVWKCLSGRHNAQREDDPSSFCTEPSNRDCPNCASNECLLKAGEESKPIQFSQSGQFDYFCRPHKDLGMTGIIVVK